MSKPRFLPENPYPDKYGFRLQNDCWQEGFDAAISWLFEPCTEYLKFEDTAEIIETYTQHRYRCLNCMWKLKQEIRSKEDGK